jgi:hypothetical protein
MASTFRPVSAITANAASKATVRAALDEFLRSRGDDLNSIYFYFPGYELVHSLLNNPFLPDNRHLHDHVIDLVLNLFTRTYTTTGWESSSRDGNIPTWPAALDGSTLPSELEDRNAELQNICDERLEVIKMLKRTCDERLALIEQLHRACERGT